MEKEILNLRQPKTTRAALKQGAYMTSQMEILKRKKENLMNNIAQTQEKLNKLQKTLEEQQSQVKEFDRTSKNWETALEGLKMNYQLTQSQILEVQSELLRSQISNLEKQCGLQSSGRTERF